MGLFDRFKKKEDNLLIVHDKLSHFKGVVLQSFSYLKKDINNQNQWISYLNNIYGVLSSAHDKNRELTKKELADVRNWINHLHTNTRKHEKSVEALEKHMKKTIELYNKHIVELYKKASEQSKRESELRESIVKEVKNIVNDKHKETSETMEKHVQKLKDMAPEKPSIQSSSMLTKPEQKLLNLLLSETDPVAYSHIAEKTGNSINTVRVIMNNLKKRGLIEEHILPSGVKLFNATNKQKVKKLYNIDHL